MLAAEPKRPKLFVLLMTRLSQRDFAAFSKGLAALYADADAASLPERILACLRNVFACEFASFSLLDRRRGRLQTSAFSPVVSAWPGMAAHQRHLRHDPAAAYILQTGDQSALKISDFVSLRQYRDLSVYREVFGRVGCNRRLGFAIQKHAPVCLVATLNRSGQDFSEEDRQLLDALRPHLLQANEQVLVQQRTQAEQERAREKLGDLFGAGLGEIDASGRVLWLTPRARTLFAQFFPGKKHGRAAESLPEEVKCRLVPVLRRGPAAAGELAAPAPLNWRFDGPCRRRLNVRLAVGASPGRWQLLLEEINASVAAQSLARALRLTPREAEVLYWLMQGKTNWELGAILAITEKTASRHLENIFAKLKVENRTAAVRMAYEVTSGF